MKKNVLLIFVLLVVGCSQQVNNKDVININVDELKIDSKTPYSEIFESVEIVQLKQSNKYLIGKIHDVKLIGDTLFVFDKMYAKCLFLFTIKGEFINKVGAIGKGPGEYISPSSFFVDHTNRAIYITDRSLKKVFKYGYDGRFLKEVNTGCSGGAVFVNNDIDIFIDVTIRSGEKYLFKSINEKTLNENHYLRFPQDNKGWDINVINNRNKFFPLKNSILYYNYSSDIIYQISNKTVRPFIVMNSSNPLTAKEVNGITRDVAMFDESLFKLNSEGKYFGIYDFLMNDRMVYMKIDYQLRTTDIVYSVKQNKIIGQNFVDNIAHIPSRTFFDISEDKMIMVMPDSHFDFEEYKEDLKSGKYTVPSGFLESILSLDNVENNPVLLFYKVKENI